MKCLGTILALGLLQSTVSALPTIKKRSPKSVSFPLTKRTSTEANSLQRRSYNASLTNAGATTPGTFYEVSVSIGTPAQSFDLLLDTGSSNIWVYSEEAATSCPNCTSTTFNASQSSTFNEVNDYGVFEIAYGTANSGVTGVYATDIVSVGGAAVNQTIGVATQAHLGDPTNGIFGIGLAKNEASYILDNGATYPTFIDSLKMAGLIDTRAYGLSLNNLNWTDTALGEITFGADDESKYTGDLVAFPMILPAPDGSFALDIEQPVMTLNADGVSVVVPASQIAPNYTVLVDSGTGVTRLPLDQFQFIVKAINATYNSETDGYYVDCSYASVNGSMDFAFSGPNGDLTIQVPVSELVLPYHADDPNLCELGLLAKRAEDARGMYILGDTFIRSAYVYVNLDNATLSLAQATYDHQ